MRILFAEDDAPLGALVSRVLREEGHVVEWARDGDAADAHLEGGGFDLAILDVMMPGRDGFQVASGRRERGDATPILLLTARGTVDDRVRGLDAGADDYLVKPFAMPELLARVRALGRRPSVTPSETLRAGPLALDTRARRASVAGRPVELTAREYALLELFLRNPGVVLSRTQILDRVWSYDYDGASNIVETYVRYLRRKLGPASAMIRTVRGMGYRLDESP
ncbi:MAG: response regulator transcription factor [Chloroflexi bacterium]|nr:response regulator transcription factor [Chloroflexota bacterium]